MTKPVRILNKYELKMLFNKDGVDYNNFYKNELIGMIHAGKEENKLLKQRQEDTLKYCDEKLNEEKIEDNEDFELSSIQFGAKEFAEEIKQKLGSVSDERGM